MSSPEEHRGSYGETLLDLPEAMMGVRNKRADLLQRARELAEEGRREQAEKRKQAEHLVFEDFRSWLLNITERLDRIETILKRRKRR
jgi:hypothetical protein